MNNPPSERRTSIVIVIGLSAKSAGLLSIGGIVVVREVLGGIGGVPTVWRTNKSSGIKENGVLFTVDWVVCGVSGAATKRTVRSVCEMIGVPIVGLYSHLIVCLTGKGRSPVFTEKFSSMFKDFWERLNDLPEE